MTSTVPSTTTARSPGTGDRPKTRGAGLFRAFWRWHFYASFLVIPVVLVLAVTGLIYLFRFQLEPALHSDLMKVQQPPGLRLAIEDDGKGFAQRQRGMGLLGIQERVTHLGGTFAVDSAPGRGTALRVTLPLEMPA